MRHIKSTVPLAAILIGTALLFTAPTNADAAAPTLLLEDGSGGAPPSRLRSGKAATKAPVGTVIFVRGSQVVAEILDGAQVGEYFIVQGDDFRRKGKARVVRALKDDTYVLQGAGTSLREGDRLTRENELEAASRVLRQNDKEAYLAFLERFPTTEYRARVARELFRLQMKEDYPARPGSSISGTIRIAETVGRNIPRDNVQIVLDRFVIAVSSVGGHYRIDGLPALAETTTLKMAIKDPKFQLEQPLTITIPATKRTELQQDLPVTVTPTVLRGTVVDEAEQPVVGAEVWTSPYSMEFLTDENGGYEISRAKKAGGSANHEGDQPLFGGEYEVYARGPGYSVERVRVSADSHVVNPVPTIQLAPQDSRQEPLPQLALDLRAHLRIDPAALSVPHGAAPLLNP